jgi:hypothetical protein
MFWGCKTSKIINSWLGGNQGWTPTARQGMTAPMIKSEKADRRRPPPPGLFPGSR